MEFKKEDTYGLILHKLKEHSFVESNIASFNNFVDITLQKIVDEINEEIPRDEVDLWLGKIRVGKPMIVEADGSKRKIYPAEARIRKLTYSAPIELEISIGGKEYVSCEIGRIPIMVKSKYCNLYGLSEKELIEHYEDPADPGGYFIINGNEKALVMIEDLAQNHPFVENTQQGLTLKLYSARGSYRIPFTLTQNSEGILLVSFSRFKNIPAILLIKALGLLKDSEIASLIGNISEDILITNFYEYAGIKSSEEALLKIGELMNLEGTKKEILDRVKVRIDSALLAHLGTKPEARKEKAIMICKLIRHFLTCKLYGIETDKDHYANKRVRLSGDLLADLFRVNLTIFVRDLQHSYQKTVRRKKIYSIKSLVKSTLFSHRIETAFATGNWIGQRTGVTQNMDKTNRLAMLSQLQRIVSLLPSKQENFMARTLHPTYYGRFCPIDTPEGTSIGLRKNLAMLAKVSTEPKLDDKQVISILEEIGLKRK